MLKTFLAATGAASLIAASGAAFAAGPAHPANDESGTVYHGAEYASLDGRLVRTDSWNAPAGAGLPADGDELYVFVGEEGGWELRPHRYDFRDGKLVHSDRFRHDTPSPAYEAAAAPQVDSGA